MKNVILTTIILMAVLTANAGDRRKDKKQQDSGFIAAAETYEERADKLAEMAEQEQDPALKKDYMTLAEMNTSLAEHKRNAAKAQQRGKSYDWDEYSQTRAEAKTLWNKIQGKEAGEKITRKEKRENRREYKKLGKEDTMEHKTAVEKQHSAPKTYTTESGFKVRTAL